MQRQQPYATGNTRARSSWLDRIEWFGNRLPDPVVIFLILIALLIAASAFAATAGWSAINPSSGKVIAAESLLSVANVQRLLVEMPATFTGFKPLGMVLVVMLGAAIADGSGLFATMMQRAMRRVHGRFLAPAIFLIGLLSHNADDAAYVVLIPLAALAYAKCGRHPLAGIAIAYAGISGAFAADLIPGQFDVLMLGITQTAARFIDPDYGLNPLGNWWYTATLGVLLIPVAWFVSDRIVEPRLGAWSGAPDEGGETVEVVAGGNVARGLRNAGWASLGVVTLFAVLALNPYYQPLVDHAAIGPAQAEPFYSSLVAGFALLFGAAGWAYGRAAGTIDTHRDVVRMMVRGIETTAPYLVLVFFAAHFIALFSWSNLGPILAIKGAALLTQVDLPIAVMLVTLLVLSAGFDLAIGSASAKWTAMAPIVVPMLMLVGVSPEMTTASYRMGDSIFNIVTPVASNFALVLVLAQRWRADFGIGSLIALMLPFSIAVGLTGLLLIGLWASLELPTGPGAPATYELTAP